MRGLPYPIACFHVQFTDRDSKHVFNVTYFPQPGNKRILEAYNESIKGQRSGGSALPQSGCILQPRESRPFPINPEAGLHQSLSPSLILLLSPPPHLLRGILQAYI